MYAIVNTYIKITNFERRSSCLPNLTMSTIIFRSCWVPIRKHPFQHGGNRLSNHMYQIYHLFRSCGVPFRTSSGAPLLIYTRTDPKPLNPNHARSTTYTHEPPPPPPSTPTTPPPPPTHTNPRLHPPQPDHTCSTPYTHQHPPSTPTTPTPPLQTSTPPLPSTQNTLAQPHTHTNPRLPLNPDHIRSTPSTHQPPPPQPHHTHSTPTHTNPRLPPQP